MLAGDLVGLFRDTPKSDSVADLTGRLASPSESHATLASQEFHVCTAISVVLFHSMKRPTPARFNFIPELRCRKFDVSTPDTLAAPTPLEDQGSGMRRWAGDLFNLVRADPKTDGTARVGYMVEVKVLRPADLLTPAQPIEGAATAATQKQQQKPSKGVLGRRFSRSSSTNLLTTISAPSIFGSRRCCSTSRAGSWTAPTR